MTVMMMCAALKTDQDFGPLLNSSEGFHLEVRAQQVLEPWKQRFRENLETYGRYCLL